MHFGCLKQNEIDTYWPACKELLLTSLHDRVNIYTIDDYYNAINNNQLQLWVAIESSIVIGAVVTAIDEGSAMRVCTVISLAGKRFKEWVSLFDEAVTTFAKDNNCAAIEVVTRKGFTKIFPDLIEDGTIYVRILKDE